MSNHVLLHSETDDLGEIIAIHCPLEPFDLAFKINALLGFQLTRAAHDISFKQTEEKYMVYSMNYAEALGDRGEKKLIN